MCRILEYQFPLRYQLSLGFLKNFRNSAEIELVNFQYPMQQSDFDGNYIKTKSLRLPEKVGDNHNMCEQFQNISSLTDISVLS